jgi:gliding motility-associated-like protein
MISTATCATPSTVLSAPVTVNVNQTVVPTIAITAQPSAPICAGTMVNFTASSTGGGSSPVYQWKVNGLSVGNNSASFNSAALSDGDIVSVEMTSSISCASPARVNSNPFTVKVNPTLVPAVNVLASPSTAVCPGTAIKFSAVPVNGGSSPIYQWKVNGVNTGTNSSTFTSSGLANGDVVTVDLVSNANCAFPAFASSNAVPVTFVTPVTSSVTITSDVTAAVCSSTTVTFTATPVNGGSSPSYQWQLNGKNVGTNSRIFVLSKVNDGDTIRCIVTSSLMCASTSTSNVIKLKIDYASCPSKFFMPTGFTPNGDGLNDILKPTVDGKLVNFRLSIFNRWGQKIFESIDINKGWDGKFSGTQTDSNVFVWVCSYQFEGQPSESKKGTFVLIR